LYGETSRSVLPLIAQAVLHPERDDHFILEAVKTFASWYGSYHGSERKFVFLPERGSVALGG
jgi:hypothetical protein